MGRSNWWEIPFTKTRCNRHRVQIITTTTTAMIAIDTIATSSLHSTAQLAPQKKSLVTRRRFTFSVLIHTNNRAHFGRFELLPSLLHRHTHIHTHIKQLFPSGPTTISIPLIDHTRRNFAFGNSIARWHFAVATITLQNKGGRLKVVEFQTQYHPLFLLVETEKNCWRKRNETSSHGPA